MTDEPQVEPTEEPQAVVTKYKDWHLVRFGTWEISVAPDGLSMLPRHLAPSEVADFCACARAAAEVGQKVQDENRTKTKEVDLNDLPSAAPIIAEGGLPPGAVRLPVTPRAPSPTARVDRSTIGRPRRARSGADPRQPRTTQPPNPPIPGVRANGRTRQSPAS
jgi:hypothetical protein